MKIDFRGLTFLVTGLLFSLSVYSATELPFPKTYIQKLNKIFLEEGSLSAEKTNLYKDKIQTRRDELYKLSLNERIHKKGQSKKKAKKKALEDVEHYDYLLKFIDSGKSLKEADLYRHLDNVLTFDEALKVEGNLLGYKEVMEGIRGILRQYSIKRNQPKENQAVNAKEDLRSSPFIFDQGNISEVDVLESYLGGKNPLYEGMDVW